MKNLSSNGIRGAIGISWLLPILFAICSPLIYTIIGKWPISWWLETGSSGFLLFIIVESLFIALFILLFIILIKKLLYLAKKHDKHNASISRRIGLLYRIAIVLFLKLAADSLFLVYLNTTNNLITSHIFGACCILLGFSILFCFVVKAEHNFRSEPSRKISVKTSVEEYCSGSINSPLSFYANHEIEKENESGPPIHSSAILAAGSGTISQSATHLPLTIISGQHCTLLDRMISTKPIETILGCSKISNGNENVLTGDKQIVCDISLHEMKTNLPCTNTMDTTLLSSTSLSNQQQPSLAASSSIIKSNNCDDSYASSTSSSTGYVSKSRCCNLILGSVGSFTSDNISKYHHQDNTWEHHQINDNRSLYDTTNYYQGPTNDVNNKIKCVLPENHDFVGVETLDILQGVSPDSIIGIRTSSIIRSPTGMLKKNLNNCGGDTATASVTTQTPKAQKRVTIVEEPKKTSSSPSQSFPQRDSCSGHLNHYKDKNATPLSPPIITITSSGDDEINSGCAVINPDIHAKQIISVNQCDSSVVNNNTYGTNLKPSNDHIDGVLDRITHDLDYLLNRTNEIPSRRLSGNSDEIINKSTNSNSNMNSRTCDNDNRDEHDTTSNQPSNSDVMSCVRLASGTSVDSPLISQHQISGTQIISQTSRNNTVSSQCLPSTLPTGIAVVIPTKTPSAPSSPPPPPPVILSNLLSSTAQNRSVHEVIIEESEQE